MLQNSPLSLIILAAGKGTRMKSDKAKVLHEVFGSPMVHHVLLSTEPLQADQRVVIVGHQREAVEESLNHLPVTTVVQEEQLGTGHAVLIAESSIPSATDTVMILCGDTPLIQPDSLQSLYDTHKANQATVTVLTTLLDNPTNYGRIISDSDDKVLGIVEEKDATDKQKQIKEINAGIYCVDKKFLFNALAQVGTDNSQGEVYLTDIVGIAVREGKRVDKYITSQATDVLGVNSRVELEQANAELQLRRNRALMMQGVTIENTGSVSVATTSEIGKDTLLKQGVQIQGNCTIGERCVIHPGVILNNCSIGNDVVIGPYSVLDGCTIKDNSHIPPATITNLTDPSL